MSVIPLCFFISCLSTFLWICVIITIRHSSSDFSVLVHIWLIIPCNSLLLYSPPCIYASFGMLSSPAAFFVSIFLFTSLASLCYISSSCGTWQRMAVSSWLAFWSLIASNCSKKCSSHSYVGIFSLILSPRVLSLLIFTNDGYKRNKKQSKL